MSCPRALVLLIVFSGLCTSQLTCLAQSIDNIHVVFTNQKVIVNYDLTGNPGEKYSIRLYSSHNNYGMPLRLVSGAVGDNVTAGKAKTVEWHVAEELVTFRGQITFRLKGEVMAAALALQSPAANSSVRTGKKADIKWTGGNKSDKVRIELLQDGKVLSTVSEGTNTGTAEWMVPKDIEKGTYNLRVSSGTESVTSGPVIVKTPLPLWMKLTPIAVAAAVVVIILLPDDETPPGGDPDLPNAPRPTN